MEWLGADEGVTGMGGGGEGGRCRRRSDNGGEVAFLCPWTAPGRRPLAAKDRAACRRGSCAWTAPATRVRMGLVATSNHGSVKQLLSEAGHLDVEQRRSLRRAYLYMRRKCERRGRHVDDAVAVSTIIASMRSRVDAIIVALLAHVGASNEELQALFGDRMVRLVRCAERLRSFHLELDVGQNVAEQAEDMKGLLLDLVKDAEVFMFMFAEKLHLLREKKEQDLSPWERKRIAQEVWEIYAPLAEMIGANRLKTEMEDLALYIYDSATYCELESQVNTIVKKRERRMKSATVFLKRHLESENMPCDVVGRAKHLYSIHRKMVRDGKPLDKIMDLMALRVILFSEGDLAVAECYRSFGIVHRMWTPVASRFKDYIAAPKPNGYQSLHTTVLDEENEPFEVQIRSRMMHEQGEYGMAAHWAYKEGVLDRRKIAQGNAISRQIRDEDGVRTQEDVDAEEATATGEKVYCFTPNGRILSFPLGATPIDFAYGVHTELGHSYGGALVNGDIVSSEYQLQSGDEVEVLRSPTRGPKKHWLKVAQTSQARRKIRSELHATGVMLPQTVEKKRRNRAEPDSADSAEEAVQTVEPSKAHKAVPAAAGDDGTKPCEVLWGGLRVAAHRAKCCCPIPGDEIVGYVTRGRGLSIHRADCPNAADLEQARIVSDVGWTKSSVRAASVDIKVEAVERTALLQDIQSTAAKIRKDMVIMHRSTSSSSSPLVLKFSAKVAGAKEASTLMQRIKSLPDVLSVSRVA